MKRALATGGLTIALVFASALVEGAGEGVAMAAMVFGVREHVEHAESVLVVEGSGSASARVVEVLCGFVAEQTVTLAEPLARGRRAVAMRAPRELMQHPELAVEPPRPHPPIHVIYPLDNKGALPARTPEHGGDGRMVLFSDHPRLTLDDVRRIAAEVRPDDAAIQARVIELALGRATDTPLDGARLAAAIHDVARDVPTLAALLESSDGALRAAVAARLMTILPDGPAPPADSSPTALAAWRQAWESRWSERRPSLRWEGSRWVARTVGDERDVRAWPAVPRDRKPPRLGNLDGILAALDSDDAARFEAAMRELLDGGVVRDRALRGVTTDDKARWPGADLSGLSYRSPLPLPRFASIRARTRPSSSKERADALGCWILRARIAAFTAERAAAARALASLPPCDERVRRAAWWELVDNYTRGPAHVAFERLAGCDGRDATLDLELMERLRPDAPVQHAVDARRRLHAIRAHLPSPSDVRTPSATPSRDAAGLWRSPTGRALSSVFSVKHDTTVYASLEDNAFWLQSGDRWSGPYPIPD